MMNSMKRATLPIRVVKKKGDNFLWIPIPI
jgi:hypothetical protein